MQLCFRIYKSFSSIKIQTLHEVYIAMFVLSWNIIVIFWLGLFILKVIYILILKFVQINFIRKICIGCNVLFSFGVGRFSKAKHYLKCFEYCRIRSNSYIQYLLSLARC